MFWTSIFPAQLHPTLSLDPSTKQNEKQLVKEDSLAKWLQKNYENKYFTGTEHADTLDL